MSVEAVKKRFQQEIKLRAYDDKYVDRAEEKEILKAAIELNVSIDSARGALAQVCENEGYVLESSVRRQISDLIDTFGSNDGKVDEREFNDVVTACMKACQGKKKLEECKKMVIEVMEQESTKIKTGLFSNWYARVKSEVGLA